MDHDELALARTKAQQAEEVAGDAERVARVLRQRATRERAHYEFLLLLETQEQLPFEEA